MERSRSSRLSLVSKLFALAIPHLGDLLPTPRGGLGRTALLLRLQAARCRRSLRPRRLRGNSPAIYRRWSPWRGHRYDSEFVPREGLFRPRRGRLRRRLSATTGRSRFRPSSVSWRSGSLTDTIVFAGLHDPVAEAVRLPPGGANDHRSSTASRKSPADTLPPSRAPLTSFAERRLLICDERGSHRVMVGPRDRENPNQVTCLWEWIRE